MKRKYITRLGRLAASVLLLFSLTGTWIESARGQAVLKTPVINGTNVTLEWSSTLHSGALEIAPTALGPWTVISDASVFVSNRVVTPLGQPARFFRVKNNGVPGPACPVLPSGLTEDPLITFASIQKLPSPTSEGNTRLNVRFATSTIPTTFSNIVPVLLENRLTLLRDDGQGGDTNANDGLFGGVIEVNVAELDAANARLPRGPRPSG